jgi:hypothetical protein
MAAYGQPKEGQMPKTAIQAAESHIIEGIKKQNLRAGALWSRRRGS